MNVFLYRKSLSCDIPLLDVEVHVLIFDWYPILQIICLG